MPSQIKKRLVAYAVYSVATLRWSASRRHNSRLRGVLNSPVDERKQLRGQGGARPP